MAKKSMPARQGVMKSGSRTMRQSDATTRDGDIHVNVAVGGFSGSAMRRQAMFWIGAVVVFVLFLIVFSAILLPFVAGMALAYFLDPIADRLERLGLSRLAATIVILLVCLLALTIAAMIILPILAAQLSDFISRIPDYITLLQSLMTKENSQWLKRYIGIDNSVIQQNLSSLVEQGAGFLSLLLQQLWNSGKSLIDIAGLVVVTPVVAFYMLLDWDRMIKRIDSWIPRTQLHTVRGLAREMNQAIAGFVRGQGTLCLLLGAYYAIGLTLAGLNFGLLIGFFAGLIIFIPYVGFFIGLALAIGVALVQFWPDWVMVAVIAAIFFIGQFVEGNILQPKLVGSSVELHPVWLIFALFAFGYLFGFTGMLVAVPAAAVVGVLVRFALNSYLDSPLYDPANAHVKSGTDAQSGLVVEAGDEAHSES